MNIAIVGAAYTGMAAARHLKSRGHQVSVTTTRAERAGELEAVAQRVLVMKGSDAESMRELIGDADAVVLTMAGGLGVKDGKPYMDPVEEGTPPNAASPAAQVFIEAEQKLSGLATAKLAVCNYRTGTIYGPEREHRNELKHIAGKQIPFDGKSDAMLIHRDDVVRGIEFAIDKHLSGLYNLFNDIPENKETFFARVAQREGLAPVTWLGVMKGPRGVSNRKIKQAGFSFADPLGEQESQALLG